MKDKIMRKLLLKTITNNLGKVEETEDKIICHVKKYKCKQNSYQITIPCFGHRKKYKELTEKYNLNKKIVYIIDGLEVKNKKVYIFGYDNPDIIIKNCAFLFELSGHINGNCTLENTYVRSFSTFMFGANNLTIKNMSITNPFNSSNSLTIALGANEKLEIINSTIGKEKQKTNVDIISEDKIIIDSSTIGADNIEIKSKSIQSDENSKIKSTNTLKLETKEYDKLNIESPNIEVNKIKVEPDKKKITLKKITDKKELERIKLINTLRKIKEKCIQTKEVLLQEYNNQLDKTNIYTLKK